MSVFVKGMKMPMCCADCRLLIYADFGDFVECSALVEFMTKDKVPEGRREDCPLVDGEPVMKALPPAQPRWIPVTEQTLPKENEQDEDGIQQYYLIQNEFGDMMVAAYRGNNSGYTWWEQMYTYKPIEDKVVAYMPLPTAYERSEHANS